jgi:hypothetical protein
MSRNRRRLRSQRGRPGVYRSKLASGTAMSIHVEYLKKITAAYRDKSKKVYPKTAEEKINDAINGFTAPFERLDAAIDRQNRGGFVTLADYQTAWRNALGLIDWQFDPLRSALENAHSAGRDIVQRTIVDMSAAAAKLKAQIADDDALVESIENLKAGARSDAIAAEDRQPSGEGPQLTSKRLKELAEAISLRSSRKEDAIYAEQIAVIGGQAEEDE